MTRDLFFRGATEEERRKASFSLKVSLSYMMFLLLCLVLAVVLYTSSNRSARDSYWLGRTQDLERAVSAMDDDLSALDNYTRQLLIDSTFVRFAGMESLEEKGFMYTAYEVMQSLSSRLYSLSPLPVSESFIYMKNSGYVISASQFTEVRQFYDRWRVYHPGSFDAWLSEVLSAAGAGSCLDISPYTGRAGDYAIIRDIDDIMVKSVPAVIWFELNMSALRSRFLPEEAMGEAVVSVTDGEGRHQMLIASDAAGAALADEMDAALQMDGMRVLRCESGYNGWQYAIALPESMCSAALGNYDTAFWLMMLAALLFGGLVIALLVRAHMRPLHQLSTRLSEAEDDRALLQQEMVFLKPMLQTSYLRKLLSGHVTSQEEFAYMMDFLGLKDEGQFYVLYCVEHRQDSAPRDPQREYELMASHLQKHLGGDRPLHFYTNLIGEFVVLASFPSDEVDPLMQLQHRVIALHDALMEHDLWFYAGVGKRCTQAQNLWESYEQARRAVRYAAKHRIFLPYEYMSKEADSFYYPTELSSKLQNFITMGNRQQVVEMFALLRRENFEERKLPMALLNFLLSDLKSTLLKARFQLSAQDERLPVIDERLYGQATFPLLESTALMLCECFTRTADPADPITDIEKYLEENFTDPSMCLSKLSDQFHISESYLSHLFKQKTGRNFSVCLETLRLDEAARRLREDHCNLSTLYAELGYNNPTTFRRAFKKRYGITPSEMRGMP